MIKSAEHLQLLGIVISSVEDCFVVIYEEVRGGIFYPDI